MSYRSVAASVRQSKEKHPEDFCPAPRCLWRIKSDGRDLGPCGKHPGAARAAAVAKLPDAPRDVQNAFAELISGGSK